MPMTLMAMAATSPPDTACTSERSPAGSRKFEGAFGSPSGERIAEMLAVTIALNTKALRERLRAGPPSLQNSRNECLDIFNEAEVAVASPAQSVPSVLLRGTAMPRATPAGGCGIVSNSRAVDRKCPRRNPCTTLSVTVPKRVEVKATSVRATLFTATDNYLLTTEMIGPHPMSPTYLRTMNGAPLAATAPSPRSRADSPTFTTMVITPRLCHP
mmetsp:Transcript_34123/g.64942  ORF Transcript_34123/g.64942 Transcript_34123/m.64942 type:complete len:214 (+) Transcript_34123:751-1392(+)